MARLIWLPPALSDLRAIREYYRPIDVHVAERVLATIRDSSLRLIAHPRLAPPLQGELRKLTVGRYPYLLIYRIIGDEVRILRVRHSSENWRPA